MDRKTIKKIIEILEKRYENPYFENNDPFRVLISTILSQRTKDEVTDKASDRLFSAVNTPEEILNLSEKEIAELIKPVGFYNQKAKRIREVSEILLRKYSGIVPRDRGELMKLPGVGDKTASCVLLHAFNELTIPVDTHVNRISQRLGLVPKSSAPENTRKLLDKTIPDNLKPIINGLFIQFGKTICKPLRPECNSCPIRKLCETYNSKPERV